MTAASVIVAANAIAAAGAVPAALALLESMRLQFRHPLALLALLAVPLVAWLLWRRRARMPRLVVPSGAPVRKVRPSAWARLWWMPGTLAIAAITLTAVGLAGPRVRASQRRNLAVEGIDIVVALDLSTSMLAADFRPKDRLVVAKEVLRDFVRSRENDRIGLVVFAGEAYTQCPLTLDYRVLEELLEQVRTGVIVDGTAIGNALATSVNRLRESDAKSRVVVLITDGDNNAGNVSPIEAAQAARELGIKVYTILIGRGGKVPYPTGNDLFGRTTYEQVEIAINPALMKQIAETTGGAFYSAVDRETLAKGLQEVLNSLEKSKIYEAGGSEQYDEWYALFFAPAAVLGLLGLALRSTRLTGAP
jgi:Ca-activated chloride channel homolog